MYVSVGSPDPRLNHNDEINFRLTSPLQPGHRLMNLPLSMSNHCPSYSHRLSPLRLTTPSLSRAPSRPVSSLVSTSSNTPENTWASRTMRSTRCYVYATCNSGLACAR